MYKKITITIILVVLMGIVLAGCGGGDSGESNLNSVEKEEVRTDVRSFVYDFSEYENTAEKEIEKLQKHISSNAEITYVDENGKVYYFNKEEYIDLAASLYSMGYYNDSNQIENLIITVNSFSNANVNFKLTSIWMDGENTIEASSLIKAVLVKQSGTWVIVELRESTI